MDTHEKTLIDAYNEALSRLKKVPKSDPRHIPYARALIQAQRNLKRYRRAQNN